MQKMNINEETMHRNREKKFLLNIADILWKENLITFNEKILLTMLIQKGKE